MPDLSTESNRSGVGFGAGTGPRAEVPASLWVLLGLTVANSLGTGAVTNGIFFIATESLHFSRSDNFLLGIALGLTYIMGALGVGPILRRAIERHEAVSHRAVLNGLMMALGVLCFVPWAVLRGQDKAGGEWAMWVFTMTYSPLTGALWPIIESYLAGGRSGTSLRRAIGRFNLCWSAAIPIAYWGMAPFLDHQPLVALNVLGVFHVLSLGLIWMLPRTPASHREEHHARTPAGYTPLLALCRVLLPMSYLILSVWSPYQPTAIGLLGVPVVWQTPLAATWHVSRVVMFAVLERLEGWHGRWWLPLTGAGVLVLGLIGAVGAPEFGSGGVGITVLVVSLVGFGCGMGAIYASALYYAMSVGRAEVDAGGTHEALIGVGYTLGPALGFGVGLAIDAKGFPLNIDFGVLLVGTVLVVCGLVGVWTVWWVRGQVTAKR